MSGGTIPLTVQGLFCRDELSIPTAPTNLFSFQYQDTRRTRGKAKPVTVGTSLMSGESGPKKAQKSLAAEIVAATVGPKLQKFAQRGDLEFRTF